MRQIATETGELFTDLSVRVQNIQQLKARLLFF